MHMMKYVKQLLVILLFSFAGELCHGLLDLPIPASIYGLVLLLLALLLKLIKVEAVKETGSFLVSMLPLLFVAPTVGLLSCWELIRNDLVKIFLLILLTTVLTFGVSGLLTKLLQKGGDGDD